MILTPGGLATIIVARLSDPIIPCPYGTVPVFARIPGNELPGYDHLVPTGQSPGVPTGQADPPVRTGLGLRVSMWRWALSIRGQAAVACNWVVK
jgi:hypothetical protein